MKRRGGKRLSEAKLKSVTRLLFLTTQIFALAWVSISYALAIYAVIKLGQVECLSELSAQAVTTLLGVTALKVAGNVFEHGVYGKSNTTDEGGEG